MESSTALVRTGNLCTFDLGNGVTCGSVVFCRGFCARHYSQLKRAGAFADSIRKSTAPKDLVLANVATVRKARRKLLKLAPDIVDAFKRGMDLEAQNGKTDSARWAILHTHTLEPIAPSNSPTHNGVQVNIGFKVSGAKADSD